jgi:RNA polymerase sigma-70 factor (ECF subfamily)
MPLRPNLLSTSTLLPSELLAFRGDMLRFARLQLRDEALAEDAVQDALTAALGAQDRYDDRGHLKTWLFTILRNKILDIIRDQRRVNTVEIDPEELSQDAIDDFFDENGRWTEEMRPSDWGDPERSFSNKQFWEVLDLCINRLPENAGRVFGMRELLGLKTDEICKELGISSANCWVLLHRARMSLRACLSSRWFGDEG